MTRFATTPILVPLLALLLPSAVHPQHARHAEGMAHDAAAAVLSEPGQGAFAALSEVVRVLEADPETDWSRVDIEALRAHLVEMDLLATRSRAKMEHIPGGVSVHATGDPEVLVALGRMVPAHADQLRANPGWTVGSEVREDHVTLTVTSDDPATAARIRALGFFGLMASQDHHRAHHLAIARGEMPHGR